MSSVEELINKKCPNGVGYKTLGQLEDSGIITLGRGKVISKKDIQDNPGEYPIYSSSAVGSGIFGTYGDYMFDDVRLSWSIDGGGKFFYRDAPRYSVTNVCGWLTVDKPEVLNIRYLYFALTNEWSKKVFDYVHKAHPSVIRKEYTIPVPPLEVQQEIVRMLDSFTELEAELEAELTKRKQQFTFFRDLLFSNENLEKEGGKIRRCTLGEIAEFERGGSFQKKDFIEEGEVPCIHYGQIYTRFNNTSVKEPLTYISTEVAKKQKFAHTNDLVMAITSENMEDVCKTIVWNGEQDIAVSGHTTIIRHNENPKFLAYFFQTADFFSQKRRVARGTKVIEISPESLKKIVINLPERKVQDKIAETIESFELLMTDMSSGLPAEIEARHKQYEYYRNKLLSFS